MDKKNLNLYKYMKDDEKALICYRNTQKKYCKK